MSTWARGGGLEYLEVGVEYTKRGEEYLGRCDYVSFKPLLVDGTGVREGGGG